MNQIRKIDIASITAPAPAAMPASVPVVSQELLSLLLLVPERDGLCTGPVCAPSVEVPMSEECLEVVDPMVVGLIIVGAPIGENLSRSPAAH